jgi:hypothetical protein
MSTVAVALNAEQAEKMRTLVAQLVENHLRGLAERARAVGYHRESMHLQPTEDGGALLLVHVDFDGDDRTELERKIAEYPDNDFTRWFNPQFLELWLSSGSRPQSELLFEWRDNG